MKMEKRVEAATGDSLSITSQIGECQVYYDAWWTPRNSCLCFRLGSAFGRREHTVAHVEGFIAGLFKDSARRARFAARKRIAAAACLVLALLFAPPGASAQEPPAYDRKEWGSWRSTGEYGPNGCRWDSRSVALYDAAAPALELLATHDAGSPARDLVELRDRPGRPCKVLRLMFVDRYTGELYIGPGSEVDVDHLVALSEAHRSGGWAWRREKKQRFYNDPMNHVATPEAVNASKSDRDPGGELGRPWLPPYVAARCWYAAKWIAVKTKWGLLMDDEEREALAEIEGCGAPIFIPVTE